MSCSLPIHHLQDSTDSSTTIQPSHQQSSSPLQSPQLRGRRVTASNSSGKKFDMEGGLVQPAQNQTSLLDFITLVRDGYQLKGKTPPLKDSYKVKGKSLPLKKIEKKEEFNPNATSKSEADIPSNLNSKLTANDLTNSISFIHHHYRSSGKKQLEGKTLENSSVIAHFNLLELSSPPSPLPHSFIEQARVFSEKLNLEFKNENELEENLKEEKLEEAQTAEQNETDTPASADHDMKSFTAAIESDQELLAAFINQSILPDPTQYAAFFSQILSKDETNPQLIALLQKVLLKMENSEVFLYRSTLNKLKLKHPNTASLISSRLQEAYARSLINFYLQNGDKGKLAIYSHFWYISSEVFLQELCHQAQQASIERNTQKATLFLQAVKLLVSPPYFYCFSSKCLLVLCQQDLKKLSLNKELKQQSEDLIEIIAQLLKQKFARFYKTFSQNLTTIPQKAIHPFSHISTVLEKNKKLPSKMIDRFAWDLKKIEAHFLSLIRPIEFAAKQNEQPEHDIYRPLYMLYTNRLIYFACYHMLSPKDPIVRARYFKMYIQLIKRCLELGNFNTTHALLGAFGNCAITRLKQTWNLLSDDDNRELQELEELYSNTKNYLNYQNCIQKWESKHKKVSAENCPIPFFGLYLRNFEFMSKENPTHLADGNLNSEKLEMLAGQHVSVQKYQNQIWDFKDQLLDGKYTYGFLDALKEQEQKIEELGGFEDALENLYSLSITLEPPPSKAEESSQKNQDMEGRQSGDSLPHSGDSLTNTTFRHSSEESINLSDMSNLSDTSLQVSGDSQQKSIDSQQDD